MPFTRTNYLEHYMPLTRPPEEFWSNVEDDITSSCSLWTGCTRGRGDRKYGKWYDDGKTLIASRVAFELEFGPIPPGENVLHHCDVRLCCLGSHLFLGSHADNAADRKAKGRNGVRTSTCLTDADVLAIRASGLSQLALARQYGISQPYVSRLQRGLRLKAVI